MQLFGSVEVAQLGGGELAIGVEIVGALEQLCQYSGRECSVAESSASTSLWTASPSDRAPTT